GRIIGGHEVKPHSRPYMAYLSIRSESGGAKPKTSHCGGFLVRPYAVLSAAHCVPGETVTLGAHNVAKKEPGQQVRHVDHWVIHPNYSHWGHRNDILLLKLKPEVNLTKEVETIPLARQNDFVKPGATCQVAGWGCTSQNGRWSSVLREVDLKVQSEKVCEETFPRYLQQSMLCAGDRSSKKSTFYGDSGGPLVCKGKVHGIVSHGPKKALFPEVHTRVAWFEPWIRKELRK
ncbi:DDN1 protein, partial [Ramphastos sulfuratus]|nr:DDN1 protein [Ramphastos sulfuratus]